MKIRAFLSSILIAFSLSGFAYSPLYHNACDFYFLNYQKSPDVLPTLNVDKTIKHIESFKTIYRNEMRVKIIGGAEGEPIYRIDLPSPNPEAPKILITGGVHGNEPFGVTTSLEVLERLVYNRELREQYNFVILPMLNPAGLKASSRRTLTGVDLNRSFLPGKEVQATKILMRELQGEAFVMGLDLHGARTKTGYFVIKANKNDGGLAQKALAKIPEDLLITSPTGEYPYGIPSTLNKGKIAYVLSSPGETVSNNVGTVKDFFFSKLKIPRAYTIEYPGQIEVYQRQEEFIKLVEGFLYPSHQ